MFGQGNRVGPVADDTEEGIRTKMERKRAGKRLDRRSANGIGQGGDPDGTEPQRRGRRGKRPKKIKVWGKGEAGMGKGNGGVG